jgi:hypothetical protein
MTVKKITHLKLWLSDRNRTYPSRQARIQKILKQENYDKI